jgi:acetyl-CoA carboxylase carboxyltransferase component
LAELALRDRVPLVMLLEGAGYRADPRAQAVGPVDLLAQARCSGRVPLVTAVLGASAGHGALVAPMSDFAVMTEGASIFTAGPPVVKDATGEEVTKEALGGPSVATGSGLVQNVAPDDAAALDTVRRYLSYFPSSAWSYPPRVEGDDTGPRPVAELLDIVPRDNRKVYDVRDVIAVLVDGGDWFEVQPGFGRAIVCGLGRLGGEAVAVVANQPKVMAGSIDADAADKAAHFITVADSFHLPLVFLADNPGMLPGTGSERAGVLRSGARMFAAQAVCTTPKLHVLLRKAYGFGSMVMAMIRHDGQSATFAFPGATLGAMGASATMRATGAAADEADALRQAELDASYRSARGLGFAALARALSYRQAPAAPVARVGITP